MTQSCFLIVVVAAILRLKHSHFPFICNLQHMALCCLSLHLGSSESRKTLEKFFQVGTLNSQRNLFLFSRHHIPTNSVAPFSAF